MKIVLLLSIFIIVIVLIGRDLIHAAKRNLLKDQAAWSGKDIKIKYTSQTKESGSKENDNYLKMIADEAEIYLGDQSKKEENETESI